MKKITMIQYIFVTVLAAVSTVNNVDAMSRIPTEGCYFITDRSESYEKAWSCWWRALEIKFNGNVPLIKSFIKKIYDYHGRSVDPVCQKSLNYVSTTNGAVCRWEDSSDWGYFVNLENGSTIYLNNIEWDFATYYNLFGLDIEMSSPTSVTDRKKIFAIGESCQNWLSDKEKKYLVHLFLGSATPKMRKELAPLRELAEEEFDKAQLLESNSILLKEQEYQRELVLQQQREADWVLNRPARLTGFSCGVDNKRKPTKRLKELKTNSVDAAS